MSLRAKDHLEGTKVAVFPRYCAENKVQTGSAAAGGHRSVATRKTTGDLATRRGAGDPETRAEWMKVLRYGHLRSAPVVVDACVRTEWEPPTLRAALSVSTRPSGRLLDGFLPLQRRTCPAVCCHRGSPGLCDEFSVAVCVHDKSRRSREMQKCADASAKPRKRRVVPKLLTVPERSRSLRHTDKYQPSGCTCHCATLS